MYSFSPFLKYTSPSLQIIPLELPGRGKRVGEQLLTEMQLMAADYFEQLKDRVTGSYAIYGHSMGAILAFLVYRLIRNAGLPAPEALFLSGSRPPFRLDEKIRNRALLPKEEFLRELHELGGTPPEILSDKVVADFFEPILRADFTAYSTYTYREEALADIPFHVMLGTEDDVSYEYAKDWEKLTAAPTGFTYYQGDHFFIFDHSAAILRFITSKLLLPSAIPERAINR